VRRRFVADVENLRRVWREVQDAGFLRDAAVNLVENRAAEGEPLEVARLAIGVGAGENFFPVRQAAEEKFLPDKQFLG